MAKYSGAQNKVNQKYTTKRANVVENAKVQRTAARSAAFTTAMANAAQASIEQSKSKAAQAQATADLAKYNMLLTGNKNGTNEVNPTNEGTKPRDDQNNDLINPGDFS